ncbi:MAG: carboxylating nicotinate-nucleotide diphosphorylase [Planctomycetes bacterium]|nr:carboxylating nicotinate-nucleotide diphosphorylase [Planctomycetota bacterium]
MNSKNTINLIKLALNEDIGKGDITSKSVIPAGKKVKAFIIAREDCIICGLPLINKIYKKISGNIKISLKTQDGKLAKKGKVLAALKGPARPILTGERTVLNFLQRLSGIATLTDKFVNKANKYKVKILDTRKTVPGWRMLDKYAVKTGGGINHRKGLYDAILIKNNHIDIAGGINKIRLPKMKSVPVEIEARNLGEFSLAIKLKPDIIMLDNMKTGNIKQAVKLRNKFNRNVKLEISGGVNLDNVESFARTGVDFISVGALTHSAPAVDISMKILAD